MWQLICDHQYVWGRIAADRSPWHSDGVVDDVEPIAGGGLRFSSPQSRIVIPRRNSDPWAVMRAINVEIVASSQQGGGTVIDADRCFRLSFDGPQRIVVEILGQTLRYDIPDLPLGNWVYFSFSHDGVNEFTHSYSWTAPFGEGGGGGSPINVPGQVPPVGSQGVWIGNRIGNPARHLDGSVASVKIWRIDPQIMIKTFLARPFKPSVLECWGKASRKFQDALAADPECAAWLNSAVDQIQNGFLQLLAQKSPDKLAEFWKMLDDYQKLWAAGKLGSPEMQALMVQLRDWLKNEGLFSSDDPKLRPILENPCMRKFTEAVGGLDCDPEAQALIKAMIRDFA